MAQSSNIYRPISPHSPDDSIPEVKWGIRVQESEVVGDAAVAAGEQAEHRLVDGGRAKNQSLIKEWNSVPSLMLSRVTRMSID